MVIPINASLGSADLFSLALEKFISSAEGDFERLLRKIALQVLVGTVLLTPVDTGLLQNNWQVNIGTVTADVLDANKDKGGAISRAIGKLAAIPNNGIGQVIFIYNNVEYAIFVEFGTEDMKPRAMLRDTLGAVAISLF